MKEKFLCALLVIVMSFASVSFGAEKISLFDIINENTTPEQVREAIANGADINALFDEGELDWTPLHCALTLNPDPKVALVLIEAGCDVNAVAYNPTGKLGTEETPLDLAVQNYDNLDVAEELLKRGAEASPHVLLYLVMTYNQSEEYSSVLMEKILFLIKKAGVDVNANSFKALKEQYEEDDDDDDDYHYELKQGLFLSPSKSRTRTKFLDDLGKYTPSDMALFWTSTPVAAIAVLNDEPELVKILLDAGANPDVRNIENKIALDYANELPKNSRLKSSPVFKQLRKATKAKTGQAVKKKASSYYTVIDY